MPLNEFEPVIISIGWTDDLYRSVTVSVSPWQRRTLTVGPRGATDDQARESALALLAHIKVLREG